MKRGEVSKERGCSKLVYWLNIVQSSHIVVV